jgi:hypothetical protein
MTAPRTARAAPRSQFDHAHGAIIEWRAWHGIESEEPPYERHNYPALLAMADRMLASRERHLHAQVKRGDMTAQAAHAEIATVTAIGADWHWIVTGEGEPAHISTLEARQLLLDRSIMTIAAIARDREGFSTALEDQAHMVIAMRWHLEPQRQTHLLARLNHEAHRRAQPMEHAHAA